MDLGPVWVTVGGVAGLFVIIGGIYKFRIWLWAQIERIREMWRSQKRLQADVKALQEQVAALMKLAETEDAMIDHIVSLEVGVKDMRATLAALDEQAEALDQRQRSSHEKAIMLFLELKETVEGIDKQVQEREKGWAHLSIGQKKE